MFAGGIFGSWVFAGGFFSDPLHLHPNDSSAFMVSIKLKGIENYKVWSCAMLLDLEGKNKTGFIDGSCKRSKTDEILGRQWDMNGSSIADYYHKLNALWKQYDAMIELPKEVLPDVRSAYATISSEESYRVASSSVFSSSQRGQVSAFVSNVTNRSNFQRNNQSFNTRPRPNKINNNRQSGGSGLVFENCGFNGRTIDRCFKIIGYPVDFGKKKLSNGLTLYDVMVIPEYCVTLISVHKMAKENKIFVVFDESKCYFVNQDLNLKNVLGTGDQCEGLYYYNDQDHPVELVMNVLNKSLKFDKPDKDLFCEDSDKVKDVIEKVFQDVNHINFFDLEYPETPNDDKRVDPKLNCDNKKSQSASSSSYESSEISVTADFPVNSGNDADSFATQDEGVTTLEENVFSKASKFPHWVDDMNQEMNVLLRNGTWDVVELPKDRKAIGSKWIYKIKYQSSGEIDRFKARLVAQGFSQKEGIDYEETFSHVVKMVIVRCLLNIAVSQSWPIFQLDVNNAFLYGDLDEIVYMRPPEGYFPPDLGKLKYFLGIEVVDTEKGICLNQRKYVLDLLYEYGMLACKPVDTPLLSKLVISNEATESDPVLENITNYQKLMGKLIYLTNTRPVISYDVHCLSQFMHSSLKSHLKTAFKILRYLKGCTGLGIHFFKTSGMFLSAFSDAGWAKVKNKALSLNHLLKERIELLLQ
nr:integrase, catalytic core [Tanacetum cinerariifolium]